MSMIKCPECGKEISDKATNCPNCGCPSAEWNMAEKVNTAPSLTDNYNATAIAFNDYNKKESRVKLEAPEKQVEQKKEKKKDSPLSIWACVLAIFTFTFPAALVLAIVDLSRDDKERKHGGSWFAIIWGVLAIVVYILLALLR